MRPRIDRRRGFRCSLLTLLVLIAICFGSCRRNTALQSATAEQKNDSADVSASEPQERLKGGELWNEGRPSDVLATWYNVPDRSLAKRRADGEEFTAAHNRLPIGTLVEVTNPRNGRTVRVRITDRGIHDRRVKLDVCKEAAEQLGILGKGVAPVRIQVLGELTGANSSASPAASLP
jgi:rare lipoprotein A (peptidoglycan hydrolase)